MVQKRRQTTGVRLGALVQQTDAVLGEALDGLDDCHDGLHCVFVGEKLTKKR